MSLVFDLGGVSLSGNWDETGNFPVRSSDDDIYVDSDGNDFGKACPTTENGRDFVFIGAMHAYNYVAENPDCTCIAGGDLLLFYDPLDGIALTTFDWS